MLRLQQRCFRGNKFILTPFDRLWQSATMHNRQLFSASTVDMEEALRKKYFGRVQQQQYKIPLLVLHDCINNMQKNNRSAQP